MTAVPVKDWRRAVEVDGRALDVLAAIARFWRAHHYGPSYDDIGAGAGGMSRSLVKLYVGRLRTAQLVSYDDRVMRSVQPTVMGWQRSGVAAPCMDLR